MRQEPECLPVVSYLFAKGQHKEATERLVEQLTALNPDANRDIMLRGREFGANGLLESWYLNFCNIAKLPQSFGDILCTAHLDLDNNLLESLPLRFSNLSVGGNLYLSSNKLRSLPPNFEQIRVRGNLTLYGNKLCCLPPNFDQIRVGGDLNLRGNPELTGIPADFPNVKRTVSRP